MKKVVLIALALVCCISYGCKQEEFKTVHGKKANYSISIPADHTDDVQMKGDRPTIDLEYGHLKGESIIVSIADIPPGDTINNIERLTSVSNSEFMRKAYPREDAGLQLLERKTIDVNGVESYFVYVSRGKNYDQALIQFHKGKMLYVLCTYSYKDNDPLRDYFYKVVNSVVWDKE